MKRVIVALLSITSTLAYAQDEHGHGHCPHHAEPLLTVADFSGDGFVCGRDLAMINKAINKGEYIAFYDRNADGVLDHQDRLLTIGDLLKTSTELDKQVAKVFKATEKYRDLSAAQADGFRKFTQDAIGHGIHYARLPFQFLADGSLDPNYVNRMDDVIELEYPEGLNYDSDGNLLAVFYYQGYNVKTIFWAAAQGDTETVDEQIQSGLMIGYLMRDMFIDHHAFAGEEDTWHSHIGVCWDGLDYIAMQQPNVASPVFNQHMTPQECAASVPAGERYVWNPSFNMLHLWLYDLNPCGKFGALHPGVSLDAEDEPFYQPLEDWASKMGLPYIEGGHGGGHPGM